MNFIKSRISRSYQKLGLLILGLLAGTTGLVLSNGDYRTPGTHTLDQGRLISVEPLPETAGDMCQWMPASASMSLRMVAQSEQAAAAAAGNTTQSGDLSRRQPERMIRDAYAAYSAVAVDPVNNEVVLTDENLFQILVYDRTDNTPPTARLTEPKRMIAGLRTKIEFQCGLYIDPKMGIFSR